ncbi:hypothetical protein SB781_20200 [Paraburkholderia sp. SIMBA_061]
MFKMIVAPALVALGVAACGGGGGSDTGVTAKTLKISLYGDPFVSAAKSTAKAQVVAAAASDAASAPSMASDTTATVQTLTDALQARGVPATVSPQVMDSTTLHQIVMGENNGLPPTPDQFKTDPSEWLVVNFKLDDMVTRADDPAQVAAEAQFSRDLSVFTQRAAVSGKRVFAVYPIPTCEVPNQNSAADGLIHAIGNASATSNLTPVGGIPYVNTVSVGHMGADCRTPDAYLLNLRTQTIADDIADRYKASIAAAK